MKSIKIIYDEYKKTPEELLWLKKYLLKIDVHQLGVNRGIYFLCKNDIVQYVGQSINVLSRITQHLNEKDFDIVYFLPVFADEKMLGDIEYRFIDLFEPPLNKSKNRTWMFDSKTITDALEKAGVYIKNDATFKDRIEARQKEILKERERVLKNFLDNSLFGEIRKECDRIFGYSTWLGKKRWAEIKKRSAYIMNDVGDIFSEFYGYKLAAKLALLEKRKEDLKKWIGEVEDIRELESRKSILVNQIKQLDKQKEIKTFWKSKDTPDIIA